jgi:hypothetical protein
MEPPPCLQRLGTASVLLEEGEKAMIAFVIEFTDGLLDLFGELDRMLEDVGVISGAPPAPPPAPDPGKEGKG